MVAGVNDETDQITTFGIAQKVHSQVVIVSRHDPSKFDFKIDIWGHTVYIVRVRG